MRFFQLFLLSRSFWISPLCHSISKLINLLFIQFSEEKVIQKRTTDHFSLWRLFGEHCFGVFKVSEKSCSIHGRNVFYYFWNHKLFRLVNTFDKILKLWQEVLWERQHQRCVSQRWQQHEDCPNFPKPYSILMN